MLSNRSRLTLAAVTTTLTALVIVMVAWGQPAQGTHIPDTGQVPSNCVEFQVNTLGTKSPAAFSEVDITVTSWDNGAESHTVGFTIAGLTGGQYVDISVKSGTNVQESGPYGNGTHSFSNGLQNAISHIRLCVFVQVTTTTLDETTTTLDGTTTTLDGTTTTLDGTTTTLDGTTTTVGDDVLGVVVTTSSVATNSTIAAGQIVAGDLPFTGIDAGTLGQLALALLVLGTLILAAVRSVTRTRSHNRD